MAHPALDDVHDRSEGGAFDELKARSNTIDDEGGSNETAHLHSAPPDRVARRSRAAPRRRHRGLGSSARRGSLRHRSLPDVGLRPAARAVRPRSRGRCRSRRHRRFGDRRDKRATRGRVVRGELRGLPFVSRRSHSELRSLSGTVGLRNAAALGRRVRRHDCRTSSECHTPR